LLIDRQHEFLSRPRDAVGKEEEGDGCDDDDYRRGVRKGREEFTQ
jgi:hypothetical protein